MVGTTMKTNFLKAMRQASRQPSSLNGNHPSSCLGNRSYWLGLSALLLVSAIAGSRGASYTVTNAGDSGLGTLRQAILDANADASPDAVTIAFNIPGAGVQTIAPLSPLPGITRPVVVDGYTQPGSSLNTLPAGDDAVLLIQLSGTNFSGDGLSLTGGSDGSLVRGLAISGFDGFRDAM